MLAPTQLQQLQRHPLVASTAATLSVPRSSSSWLRPSLLPQQLLDRFFEGSVWLIKRTFQPSIVRKKRKTGFLVRQRTVGGRRTLNRRRAKGRWRLGGGI